MINASSRKKVCGIIQIIWSVFFFFSFFFSFIFFFFFLMIKLFNKNFFGWGGGL